MIFKQYKRNFWVHIEGILCFRDVIFQNFGSFCCPLEPVRKIYQKKRDFDGCSKWPASIHRGCLAYLELPGIVYDTFGRRFVILNTFWNFPYAVYRPEIMR